jgi:arylsulfatase A-like enzyme
MTRPNLIFILIDDMGWRDLSCCGSTFYETPNIDRLAAEGVRFTNAYAASPVCSPTRSSILTGRYPARTGVTNFIGGNARGLLLDAPYTWHLRLEEYSLARAMKDGGYNTWHVGKWHLGGEGFLPQDQGFDVNIGGCHMGHPHQGYFSPYDIPGLANGPDGEYLTDRLTDEAIKLIRLNEDKPFFLNMCYYSVHTPIQAKKDIVERFRTKARQMGLDKLEVMHEGQTFPCQHKQDQKITRRILQSDPDYAAMIWSLDQNIGRLLAALEESGQTDNTAIVFTSDNGGLSTAEGSPTCNLPLAEGKGWMYDGGVREPLLIKWPGVTKAGTVSEVPVTSPDFYPTILEMAGLPPRPEQHCDGISLAGLLRDGTRPDRQAIFWHYPHYGNQGGTPGSALRAGDWKLIEFFEDGRLELYNLSEDISEQHNLASAQPELTRELHALLINWREQVAAKIPQPNPDYGKA